VVLKPFSPTTLLLLEVGVVLTAEQGVVVAVAIVLVLALLAVALVLNRRYHLTLGLLTLLLSAPEERGEL
jgi:hypothetical protein